MKRPLIKGESRRLVLSSVLLIVLSLCAFMMLVWEPQQTELAEIALRQAELKTARLESETFSRRHPDLARYEQLLNARYKRGERLFFQSEGEADTYFRKELPEMAEEMGLTVEQLSAVNEAEATAARQQENRQPVHNQQFRPILCRMTIHGSYGTITEFLSRLEQGEHFVSVKSWQLKRSDNPVKKGQLTLDFTAEAYCSDRHTP